MVSVTRLWLNFPLRCAKYLIFKRLKKTDGRLFPPVVTTCTHLSPFTSSSKANKSPINSQNVFWVNTRSHRFKLNVIPNTAQTNKATHATTCEPVQLLTHCPRVTCNINALKGRRPSPCPSVPDTKTIHHQIAHSEFLRTNKELQSDSGAMARLRVCCCHSAEGEL